MKVDTNKPYEVPEQYKAKKVGEPKMKKSAVIMVVFGWILAIAIFVAIVWGAIFGITKLVEAINNANQKTEPETSVEVNQA